MGGTHSSLSSGSHSCIHLRGKGEGQYTCMQSYLSYNGKGKLFLRVFSGSVSFYSSLQENFHRLIPSAKATIQGPLCWGRAVHLTRRGLRFWPLLG